MPVARAMADALKSVSMQTRCTDCRMKLAKLEWQLEQAEACTILRERDEHVLIVSVKISKALERLSANVHVCRLNSISYSG